MTPEEAIELLRSMQNPKQDYADVVCAPVFCTGFRFVYPEPEDYAIEEAISALKEIQQYREIGASPEQLKELIFEGSATKRILRHYQEIGTVEECREAREKQIPKRPKKIINSGVRYTDEYVCPNCEKHFTGTGIADYCYHCGQAIQWDEKEGERGLCSDL